MANVTEIIEAIKEDENVNFQCALESGGEIRFPCDVEAPVAVSVAIGGGGLALLFVMYLLSSVSLVVCFFLSNSRAWLFVCWQQA